MAHNAPRARAWILRACAKPMKRLPNPPSHTPCARRQAKNAVIGGVQLCSSVGREHGRTIPLAETASKKELSGICARIGQIFCNLKRSGVPLARYIASLSFESFRHAHYTRARRAQ